MREWLDKNGLSRMWTKIKAYFNEKHISKTDNPHKVTAAQVGLGNVNNVSQYSQYQIDNMFDDIAFIGGSTDTAYGGTRQGIAVLSGFNHAIFDNSIVKKGYLPSLAIAVIANSTDNFVIYNKTDKTIRIDGYLAISGNGIKVEKSTIDIAPNSTQVIQDGAQASFGYMFLWVRGFKSSF